MNHVCPNCGYCPCCGRRNLMPYNPWPYDPYIPYVPSPYPGPIWISQPGTVTVTGTTGVTYQSNA